MDQQHPHPLLRPVVLGVGRLFLCHEPYKFFVQAPDRGQLFQTERIKGFLRRLVDEDRRHHAPYVQGAVVHHGKQAGGVDTHQPVRLAAAEGGGVEVVVLPTDFVPRICWVVRRTLQAVWILPNGHIYR